MRWIELTGISKKDLKLKAQKVVDKLHEILGAHYKAERYARLGTSIRLHKTQLKIIIKIPDVNHLRWQKIKNRVGDIPGWIEPKKIDKTDTNYFNINP